MGKAADHWQAGPRYDTQPAGITDALARLKAASDYFNVAYREANGEAVSSPDPYTHRLRPSVRRRGRRGIVATVSAFLTVGSSWSSHNNFAWDKSVVPVRPIQIDYVHVPPGHRA